MLTMRSAQTTAFEQYSVRNFVHRAVAHLRKELPDNVRGKQESELYSWVNDAMQRAASFNLRTEKGIMYFLDAEVLLGVRFYEQPAHGWAGQVLMSGKLSPDDKASLLLATACSLHRETLPK